MSDSNDGHGKGYRINLQFYGADHPLLAGEMDRLPKGKRRVGRLLTLATLGLTHEALTRLELLSLGYRIVDPAVAEHKASDSSDENAEIAMSQDDVRDLRGE